MTPPVPYYFGGMILSDFDTAYDYENWLVAMLQYRYDKYKVKWSFFMGMEALMKDRKYTAASFKKMHSERMRKDRLNRPEHHKEIASRSYAKHRESHLQKKREYYKNNPELYKQNAKKYREENLDRVLYWNRQRKIRKQEIPGNHSFGQWLELCSFFDVTCPCCNEKDVKLTVDHIVPISWDNTSDWITNIQPLCKSCNSSKNNSHDIDYRPEHVKVWASEQVK